MAKLHIKFTHFVVSSVSLISDQNLESENISFSLKHIGVRKFFDGVGEFCTGEIKFPIIMDEVNTGIILKPEIFAKIEDFDQLQLAIYADDKQVYRWLFRWPDTFGDNELDIELDLVTDGAGEDGAGAGEDGAGAGEDGAGAGAGHLWKRVGVIAVVAAVVVLILGFIVFETGVLDQKLGSLSKKKCTTRSYMISAMETEETKSKFFDLCARNFVELTEREFGEVLADMTTDKSMLLPAGRLFDTTSDNNFLKMLRPNTQVNLLVALQYYSEAKAADISGASELLTQACGKLETTFETFTAQDLCKIND